MINIERIRLIDLIPPNLRKDENVRAAAESLDQQLREITDLISEVAILHHLDTLDERWVDELAWQFHVDFYEPTLPIEQKRELVKNSLAWHKRKGTPSAVSELITTIFGNGHVREWYQYGGEPGHFKVVTSDPTATNERAHEFLAAINSVKNVRSWLDKVELIQNEEMKLYFGGFMHTGEKIVLRQVD